MPPIKTKPIKDDHILRDDCFLLDFFLGYKGGMFNFLLSAKFGYLAYKQLQDANHKNHLKRNFLLF